ncbi:NAD(P)-dependent oxidoreductase [Terriglobus sp.]|uniref:NAD(P)-dependent oxidoreductase n=1 Tax=Terriglobus sp. TaxID=1889013 RepID=UPI003AFFF67E
MQVTVFGAAGKTGRLVVEQAAARGYSVTAFVHSAKDFAPVSNVEVVEGDVNNFRSVVAAIAEGCAVIDCIGGSTPYKQTGLEQKAAENILQSMEQKQATPLVVISAVGVAESKEQATFAYEHLLMPTFLRGAMKDKTEMEQEVKSGAVAFTIVRPPALKDADATGKYAAVPQGETAESITRADLASFLLDQLTDASHRGTAVTVANV